MTHISITQHDGNRPHIKVEIAGWSAATVVLGLRLVATGVSNLDEKFNLNDLEMGRVRASVDQFAPGIAVFDHEVTSLRIHMPLEHQADMMAALQRAVAPTGDDHDELFALERWVAANHEEAVKRHWRGSEAAVELAARLICLLQIMHTVLDNPRDLDATIAEWRRRRVKIMDHMGS